VHDPAKIGRMLDAALPAGWAAPSSNSTLRNEQASTGRSSGGPGSSLPPRSQAPERHAKYGPTARSVTDGAAETHKARPDFTLTNRRNRARSPCASSIAVVTSSDPSAGAETWG
jgi:hypothetical protein